MTLVTDAAAAAAGYYRLHRDGQAGPRLAVTEKLKLLENNSEPTYCKQAAHWQVG